MGIMDQFSQFVARKQGERSGAVPGNGQPQGQPQGATPPGSSNQLELSQGQQPPGAQPTGGGATGTGGQQPNAPQPPALDNFKDLWQPSTTPNDPGKSKPFIDYDRAKLREKAKTLNFAQTLDPALMQKAVSGDVGALSQLLNSAVQGAFVLAMDGSMSLTESGFSKAQARFLETLPSEVKKHSTYDASVAANPKLKHPAVAPLMEVLQTQMQSKFPDASSADIQKYAHEYLTEVFNIMRSDDGSGERQPGASGSPQKPGETDWDNLMGLTQP